MQSYNKMNSKSGKMTVIGMGFCYALGTFTDNFYKQAAIILAASLQMTSVQSVATILFSLPYLLFSAWTGWMADRTAKKNIVVAAKGLELAALLAGGAALTGGSWTGILAVVFVMGVQASIFGPAINGSIPEHFPPERVPRANSFIKLASTIAILIGIACAGLVMDARPEVLRPLLSLFGPFDSAGGSPAAREGEALGRLSAACFVVAIALLGFFSAFVLRKKKPAHGHTPFPWGGPAASIRHISACRKDPALFLVLLSEAWFYGLAAIAILSVANLAEVLRYSHTVAALLSATLTLGLAVGAVFGGRVSANGWRTMLVPSACAIGLALILVSLTPWIPVVTLWRTTAQQAWFFAALFLVGIGGGVYLIPLISFIQIRPAANRKGQVQGVSNFMCFAAMTFSGALFFVIGMLPPALTFALYGLLTLGFAKGFAAPRLRNAPDRSLKEAADSLTGTIMRALLSLRYRVKVSGLEAVPAPGRKRGDGEAPSPGILFLPNHPALIDPILLYSRLAGLRPRPLASARQMRGILGRLAARLTRTATIPDANMDGEAAVETVVRGLKEICSALKQGDNVLLYPSGRLYRSERETLGGNSGAARILAEIPNVRVVLVKTDGLWGSAFSYALGRPPHFQRELTRGVLTLLSNLFLFTPKREVRIEFVEPPDLPRDGDKIRLNAWLEAFYNRTAAPALAVPRYFWQGRRPVELPSRQDPPQERTLDEISPAVQEAVYACIRAATPLRKDLSVTPQTRLSADLYLDSLALVELGATLETEFGHPIPNLERLITVGDCMLAAAGKLGSSADETESPPMPPLWFAPETEANADDRLSLPNVPSRSSAKGTAPLSIPDAFLRLARLEPGRALLADRSGVTTRRDALLRALALSRRLHRLPGTRLGIMLPAAPAAVVVWLAALLAGKEPVFLNWTAGSRNLAHCLRLAGVSHALTATALLDQLEQTGKSVRDAPATWIAVDAVAAAIPLREKLLAAVRAALHCRGLCAVSTRAVPRTAAVLFTSGSEAAPKGVPLTHANLLANAGDLLQVLSARRRDRLLAMLPPFHSFGLMAGLTLPAASGLPAVFHPNPTESAPLVLLVRNYRVTLTGTTPTFLSAMLARANGKDHLATLRYAFVGAEACPERVCRAFALCCPSAALCEGYGITECSPVVSVNRPDSLRTGSIGMPLPSVNVAVVHEEEGPGGTWTFNRVAPPPRTGGDGPAGMLLVRGPSVFSGYLGDAPSPFVAFEGSLWYRTGDLVAQDAEGRLVFKGRLKRFVKIGGEMISLPQIEAVLQEHLEARGLLPADGAPCIAVEARPGSEAEGQAEIHAFTTLSLEVQELNEALFAAGLSAICAIKAVVRIKDVPLLGSGKTDYRTLQGLFPALRNESRFQRD